MWVFLGMQYPPDHNYIGFSSPPNTKEAAEMERQTDIGMDEMTELLDLKTKSQNPDAVMKEFVRKVTSSDKSVKQSTGVPLKPMLDELYCKYMHQYLVFKKLCYRYIYC